MIITNNILFLCSFYAKPDKSTSQSIQIVMCSFTINKLILPRHYFTSFANSNALPTSPSTLSFLISSSNVIVPPSLLIIRRTYYLRILYTSHYKTSIITSWQSARSYHMPELKHSLCNYSNYFMVTCTRGLPLASGSIISTLSITILSSGADTAPSPPIERGTSKKPSTTSIPSVTSPNAA